MIDLPINYQKVYQFIQSEMVSFLVWPELETAVSYWIARHQDTPRQIAHDLFPLLTCLAIGGKADKAIPLAAFWLLNLITARVFDDIQDGEGKSHPWHEQGITQSLPTGIGLQAVADICLTHLSTDKTAFVEILVALKRATVLAAKAQSYPLTRTSSLEAYFANSLASTGEILAVGAWAGGRLETNRPETLQALHQFGQNVGLKMAILNDCRDLAPIQPDKQSDLATANYKLPILYAVSLEDHTQHTRFGQLLNDDEPLSGRRLQEMVQLLEEMGAIAWCVALADRFGQQALAALEQLPTYTQEQLQAYA